MNFACIQKARNTFNFYIKLKHYARNNICNSEKKIINLVSNDKTKKALELLKHVTHQNPNDFSDAIFIQLSEFELLQLSSLKGILSYEEEGLKR